jgi:hypothetical protein
MKKILVDSVLLVRDLLQCHHNVAVVICRLCSTWGRAGRCSPTSGSCNSSPLTTTGLGSRDIGMLIAQACVATGRPKQPSLYRLSMYEYNRREERPREETLREYWYLSEGGPLCTKQAARTVDSVLRSDAVQILLCWLACFVHNRPPSPKFQIFPSQLRQRADRAAGLSIKGLWVQLYS